MSAIEIAVIILAASVPLTALSVAAAFYFMNRQNEAHLLACFDRFLSRNMSEYAMTDLVKNEITADQDEQQGEESEEDQIFEKYMAERKSAVELLGTEPVTEGVE